MNGKYQSQINNLKRVLDEAFNGVSGTKRTSMTHKDTESSVQFHIRVNRSVIAGRDVYPVADILSFLMGHVQQSVCKETSYITAEQARRLRALVHHAAALEVGMSRSAARAKWWKRVRRYSAVTKYREIPQKYAESVIAWLEEQIPLTSSEDTLKDSPL